mmetsp:Transcript_23105/g.54761  ORF Transcript_23105/g.54761 Transcript_23105/m.54761 type:complete len:555 (-) Transcript_23105:158-1822(-)
MGSLVNFSLTHGYLASTPLFDMSQVYHQGTPATSLQNALDDCAAIGPCAAVSFFVGESAGREGQRADEPEGKWFSFKRYPPGGASLPTVWPHESWRTYVRVGPPPISIQRSCDAHECAGIQPPCSPTSPPQWGWAYRAASASAFPRKLAFKHTGQGDGLQVYWHDGVSDSRFLHLIAGGRQEVTTYSGTLWHIRRPPPSNELVHEYVASRLLMQHCKCAAQLAPVHLHAAALSAVANAALIAFDDNEDGKGEGEGEGGGGAKLQRSGGRAVGKRTSAHGGRERARGPAPVLCYPPKTAPVGEAGALDSGKGSADLAVEEVDRLDLHFFNAAPLTAKLVRVRFQRDGAGALCDAGELGSGLDLVLPDLRLGDLLVACPVRANGYAECAEPVLVHRLRDIRLGDCDGGAATAGSTPSSDAGSIAGDVGAAAGSAAGTRAAEYAAARLAQLQTEHTYDSSLFLDRGWYYLVIRENPVIIGAFCYRLGNVASIYFCICAGSCRRSTHTSVICSTQPRPHSPTPTASRQATAGHSPPGASARSKGGHRASRNARRQTPD